MRQVDSAADFSVAFVDRITRYRKRAEQFRELAECESNGRLRENLFDLASRYDVIADGLCANVGRLI
jgi:hypothetical protein